MFVATLKDLRLKKLIGNNDAKNVTNIVNATNIVNE